DVARNKTYREQYEKAVGGLATQWGTDPAATKRAVEDFSTEPSEDQLKRYAALAKDNPIFYNRLKSGNDIRLGVAGSGRPDAINDANVLNTLFSPEQTSSYQGLQDNIAMAQEILHKHGLNTQAYDEKLKTVYSPLINTLQPGLLLDYFNSPFHQ